MEVDFDIFEPTTFYDRELIHIGTYNDFSVVWKPFSKTEEENTTAQLFSETKVEKYNEGLDAILNRRSFQLASATPQTFDSKHTYIMLTSDAPEKTEADEHFDKARDALINAVGHGIAAGVTIVDCPPLGVYEGYKSVQSFMEMGEEYCKGVELEEALAQEEEKH